MQEQGENSAGTDLRLQELACSKWGPNGGPAALFLRDGGARMMTRRVGRVTSLKLSATPADSLKAVESMMASGLALGDEWMAVAM